MNKKSRNRKLRNSKRRILNRLKKRESRGGRAPSLFSGSNIHYEVSERQGGISYGGIGAVHLLSQRSGLVESINEVYLNALGAERIPDPTTAGDFFRRFQGEDVESLMGAINDVRVKVWQKQPKEFFEEAAIEADGTLVSTTGECKEGMDISYKGEWGFHPLLVSLANTQEPLFIENRSGNRDSAEGAAHRFDQAIELCQRAGFEKITLRGDTAFSHTKYFDEWSDAVPLELTGS